ncbi:hypothetical protein IV286_05915 [Enterococcus faecium]|nr:hypothetical protein [Enterococcus faecium]MCD5204530.1 hypothetical protein [Enterococcus faecium]MCD5214672.1 hypothetical protein [Enterococcus faecium]MCD5224813.1 hypothetical protein [Enterococcus faecium]
MDKAYITIKNKDEEKKVYLPLYGEIILEIRNGEIIYIVNNEREKWQK